MALVKFMEGGLSYEDARTMPIEELIYINKKANEMSRDIQRSIKKK